MATSEPNPFFITSLCELAENAVEKVRPLRRTQRVTTTSLVPPTAFTQTEAKPPHSTQGLLLRLRPALQHVRAAGGMHGGVRPGAARHRQVPAPRDQPGAHRRRRGTVILHCSLAVIGCFSSRIYTAIVLTLLSCSAKLTRAAPWLQAPEGDELRVFSEGCAGMAQEVRRPFCWSIEKWAAVGRVTIDQFSHFRVPMLLKGAA